MTSRPPEQSGEPVPSAPLVPPTVPIGLPPHVVQPGAAFAASGVALPDAGPALTDPGTALTDPGAALTDPGTALTDSDSETGDRELPELLIPSARSGRRSAISSPVGFPDRPIRPVPPAPAPLHDLTAPLRELTRPPAKKANPLGESDAPGPDPSPLVPRTGPGQLTPSGAGPEHRRHTSARVPPPEPAPRLASVRAVDGFGVLEDLAGLTALADLSAAVGLDEDDPGQLGRLPNPQRTEPLLLAALAAGGALADWGASARVPAWAATAAVLAAAASALRRPGSTRTSPPSVLLLRALVVIAAATVSAVTDPSMIGLGLVWVMAVAVFYPQLLPRAAATTTTLTAVLTLCGWASLRLSLGGMLQLSGPDATAPTLAVLAGVAAVAALGVAGAVTRSALAATSTLVERRDEVARNAAAELTRVATSDPLTGLPNGTVLSRRIARALSRRDVVGGQVALFLIEVDRFTTIADTLGRAAAEDVLRQVGRRLRASASGEDVVARVTGCAFAVLVEGLGPDDCPGMARRMIALLEEPMSGGGRSVSVTCSVGIAISGGTGPDTPEELVPSAAEALRAAQRGGRARWAMFDQAMRAHAVSQGELELQLRQAVSRHELEVLFQPVYALAGPDGSRRLVGAEAVPHWQRPDGSVVPVQRFLALAEEIGLGGRLGLQLLELGLDALAGWHGAGVGPTWLGVTVGGSLLQDPQFARQVGILLSDRGLPPSALVIEVSATSYRDGEQARSTLGMLRSLGVEIALDGFGQAGASLVELRQLPIGLVGLDRRVSLELARDHGLARAAVTLCHTLGLPCLVKGVETPAQLEAARALGVFAAAGPLLGAPAPAADLVALLAIR